MDLRKSKYRERGKLVRYLKIDEPNHIFVEETNGAIKKIRATDFRPYFTSRDATAAFSGTLRHEKFEEGEKAEQNKEAAHKEAESTEVKHKERAENITNRFKRKIPTKITPTTESPATRHHALRYPDKDVWERSMNEELDKLDKLENNGTIRWLLPAQLGIMSEKTKAMPLTVTFNYKRHKEGTIEERKSRESLRRDQIIPKVHYDPANTTPPMVY